jgi:hypothetical protein
MKTLHLTLKKRWFDMIASGEKTEEYREIKPYWSRRLESKNFDAIQFRNGYSKNAPTMIVSLVDIVKSVGCKKWGAPSDQVYVLKLGKIISVQNA